MSVPHRGVANLNLFVCVNWDNMMETEYKPLHIFFYPQWKALVHEIAAVQGIWTNCNGERKKF